jgi:hypothetical protein
VRTLDRAVGGDDARSAARSAGPSGGRVRCGPVLRADPSSARCGGLFFSYSDDTKPIPLEGSPHRAADPSCLRCAGLCRGLVLSYSGGLPLSMGEGAKIVSIK